MDRKILEKMHLPKELIEILETQVKITVPKDRKHLLSLALGEKDVDRFGVGYEVEGKGYVLEATVTKCTNGMAINYMDEYMRRRDPDCMAVADEGETDKNRYRDRYGKDFTKLRERTLRWLENQELIIMPFMAGGEELGYEAVLVAPKNTGFFAAGLADLQGFIPREQIREGFEPKAIIYVAPPFRHTHFEGKQVVVHNRLETMHELFSYNLYPGPSAKKGIYGVLLNIGETEGWITVHAATVKVTTPYDNEIVIMHEGASGGGKSEMIEKMHREMDGSVVLATNTITGEKTYLSLSENCDLQPVTDDMAVCHPSMINGSKKLVVKDAEEGWFLRINHITEYGTDPYYEKLTIHPPEPLIFLNLKGEPNTTCLIWEHIMDAPNQPCPNPRVIIPRRFIPEIINEPVEIDARSFGVRTPACTKDVPSYGIIGMFHVLPPALAWLWRLVSPRGHNNPSITESQGLSSEGVGSYWPFATGRRVDQANLLLEQIVNTPHTRYFLIPNQYIGAYEVGFMGEWMTREYLARRGSAKFKRDKLEDSRCHLLGYTPKDLKIDGHVIPQAFLQVDKQPEVGCVAYDQGAMCLTEFFKKELKKFLKPDLHPLGREIIECCLNNGALKDYEEFIPIRL